MTFCPKCGSILIPTKSESGDKVMLKCSCGYAARSMDSFELTEKIRHKKTGTGAGGKEEKTLGTAKAECPKCKHPEAYWWTVQTRGSDEPETQFFRCTKCKYTWREYS